MNYFNTPYSIAKEHRIAFDLWGLTGVSIGRHPLGADCDHALVQVYLDAMTEQYEAHQLNQ